MTSSVIRLLAVVSACHYAIANPIALELRDSNAKHGARGAVASEDAICSQIGIDLLKQGGNAADAMVGTVACVGTVGAQHSGILIAST